MVLKSEMAVSRREAIERAARVWALGHFSVLGVLWPGSAASAPGSTGPRRLVVVGDSLSAEYGLSRGSGWVALLAKRMAVDHSAWQVVNASISGDTTSGGRSRLPALLKLHQPRLVVIELGGNDALRGLPLAATKDNLVAMTQLAQDSGAKVLILGMQVPSNYGAKYNRDFGAIFAEVAQSRRAALVPFLLSGVADRADAEDWFQPDRIHPKAQAHPLMLENVWPTLQPLLS